MVTGGFHLLVAVAGGWDMWRDIIMDRDLPLPLGMMRKGHTLLFFLWADTAPFGGYIAVLYP